MPTGRKPKKSPGLINAEKRQRTALQELTTLKQSGVARKGQIERAQQQVDKAAARVREIRRARGGR